MPFLLASSLSNRLTPPPVSPHTGNRALRDLAHFLHILPVIVYIASVVAVLALAVSIGFGLSRLFRRYARRFETTWAGLLFSLLEPLPLPLLILAALYAALEWFSLPRRWDHVGSQAILVLVIFVLFYFPTKAINLFLSRLSQKQPTLERVTQPASFLIKVLFFIVGLIVVLENLGVHLTVVWTTLGVGSVAVALALQDTLGNFFAGLYILADRPVNLSDYIRLDSGPEGFVVRVGWRSTLLRTASNNMVIVPNSTLAKAVITNFSLPAEPMWTSVQVGVAYGTDARRVEKLLIEIARQAAKEGFEGLLAYPEPSAQLNPGFGDSALNFSLNFQVRRWSDQTNVQSELRKRILERFAEEGINMPFPTRTLIFDRSADGLPGSAALTVVENKEPV
jgi:small-conductance mechanosensitive channel